MFAVLNGIALIGWSAVLLLIISDAFGFNPFSFPLSERTRLPASPPIILLYILEGICFMEVGRIALGHIKGNFILGIVLHSIRMICLTYVILESCEDLERQRRLILFSWSVTEMCRYPMYLFPSSQMARAIRLVVPIITFPLGCALEAYVAFRTVMSVDGDGKNDGSSMAEIPCLNAGLLWTVILINGLLGPTLAYPAILKKGLPVLVRKKLAPANERIKNE